MNKEEREREKELKYMIYLIDSQIYELKREKKKYVDELNSLGCNKKYIKTKNKNRT